MKSPNDMIAMVSELINIIISYVKSQTLVPLKRLGRYLGLGIVGSLFMTNGAIFVSLGILRYLQTLDSSLSFLPYVILAVVDICLLGIIFFVATRPTLIREK